ncbi:heavy-metal-associated domain-containing protein [Maribacter chungangensis]|uniref:Heavy-metal-associated domain-containing protein n=1 Tax=Maribacter chungangensis TaxID=1069117 RepID=A0ABW3B742_9FLAO
MKSLLTMLSLFLFVNISLGQENQKDILSLDKNNLSMATIGIEGMACQEGCADKIASNLQHSNGVVSALVSYAEKEAVITYDAGITTPELLKNIITNTKVKDYVCTIDSITIKERIK